MAAQSYLITAQEIKDSTYIDNNVEDNDIDIAIIDAQDIVLEDELGTALYEKLLDDNVNKVLSEDYQELVIKKIWPVLYQAVQIQLLYNLLYRLTRSSVVKSDNENSKGISVNEINILIAERQMNMNSQIRKLKRFLEVNTGKYPEYNGPQPADGNSPDYGQDYMAFWDWDLT